MTGVARFVQRTHANLTCGPRFPLPGVPAFSCGHRFSKAESWAAAGPATFDWLLTDAAGPARYNATHQVAFAVPGFAGLGFTRAPPFLAVRTRDQLFALQRRAAPPP
jgi:hypothetical protein